MEPLVITLGPPRCLRECKQGDGQQHGSRLAIVEPGKNVKLWEFTRWSAVTKPSRTVRRSKVQYADPRRVGDGIGAADGVKLL